MADISLRELNRIAREIEASPPDERGDVSKVEFNWLYTPGEPLHPLKKQEGDMAKFFMRFMSCFVTENFSRTDATTHVHNHPSGNVKPTLEDLNLLLGGASRNKNLSAALIASTRSGAVKGFYELNYNGKRSKAASSIESNLDIYRVYLNRKYDLLKRNPELRAKMNIGENVLSPTEYFAMVSEAMDSSYITGRPRPLKSYRFENWGFVPEQRIETRTAHHYI